MGHVVRSLALAELLCENFSCTFAIQEPSEALQEQLRTVCINLKKLPQTNTEAGLKLEAEELANQLTGQEIIVLDGYHFTTEYQQTLKQKGSILVCLDDLHDRHFVADAIINIAGGVKPAVYAAAAYTKYCLGTGFALLRQPFREAQKTLPERSEKLLKVLVCFGGADPENFTLRYAHKLAEFNQPLHLAIVTGSAYQHGKSLQEFLTWFPAASWHQNLSSEAMATLMQECRVAVCSASSIAYEYCAVTGMLFIEKTAANQADLNQYLLSEKLALPAETLPTVLNSPECYSVIESLTENQRNVFNGQAEENLKKVFAQLRLQAQLAFRKVTSDDADLLFEWANEPAVRQFSFNPEPIPFETHLNWLNGKLASVNSLLLLAEIKNQPAALLRFELQERQAIISYQIGADFRGKGLGHRVLQLGLRELKKHFPEAEEAIGYVQAENIPSVRAFEKAEFSKAETLVDGKKSYCFSQKLPE